jgi:hypothetical protein
MAASHVAQLPPKRSDDGYQRVIERWIIVAIAQKNVEGKGNVDGKPSDFQSEFSLVPVIDALIEIDRWGRPYGFHRWL